MRREPKHCGTTRQTGWRNFWMSSRALATTLPCRVSPKAASPKLSLPVSSVRVGFAGRCAGVSRKLRERQPCRKSGTSERKAERKWEYGAKYAEKDASLSTSWRASQSRTAAQLRQILCVNGPCTIYRRSLNYCFHQHRVQMIIKNTKSVYSKRNGQSWRR